MAFEHGPLYPEFPLVNTGSEAFVGRCEKQDDTLILAQLALWRLEKKNMESAGFFL
jgi:hypothetical protein